MANTAISRSQHKFSLKVSVSFVVCFCTNTLCILKMVLSPTISDLNETELFTILSKLPLVDLFTLRSVCRQWSKVAIQVVESNVSVLNLQTAFGDEQRLPVDPQPCLEAIRLMIKHSAKLSVIDLSSFATVYNFSLEPRWEYQGDGEYAMKVNYFPFNDNDLHLISVKCPSLRTLKLSWLFDSISDDGLRDIITCCLNLERLDLDDCWNITGKYFHMSTSRLQRVNCLEMSHTAADVVVHQLGKSPARLGLRALLLGLSDTDAKLQFNAAEVLQYLCDRFKNLTYFCWGFKINVENSTQVISSLYNLETLDIRTDGKSLNDTALNRIMRNCPKLKRVALELYPITKSSTEEEFDGEEDETSDPSRVGITDEGLRGMPMYCQNIEAVALTGCNRVSDKGVINIIMRIKKLTLLKVDCPEVTADSVCALVQICGLRADKHMKFYLNVDDMPEIEDIKNLTKLEDTDEFDELFYRE